MTGEAEARARGARNPPGVSGLPVLEAHLALARGGVTGLGGQQWGRGGRGLISGTEGVQSGSQAGGGSARTRGESGRGEASAFRGACSALPFTHTGGDTRGTGWGGRRAGGDGRERSEGGRHWATGGGDSEEEAAPPLSSPRIRLLRTVPDTDVTPEKPAPRHHCRPVLTAPRPPPTTPPTAGP